MAAHPGFFLKLYMGYAGFSPEYIASQSGISTDDLRGICNENVSVSDAIATGLEQVFPRSKSYWLGLQSAFDAEQ